MFRQDTDFFIGMPLCRISPNGALVSMLQLAILVCLLPKKESPCFLEQEKYKKGRIFRPRGFYNLQSLQPEKQIFELRPQETFKQASS